MFISFLFSLQPQRDIGKKEVGREIGKYRVESGERTIKIKKE